MKSIDGKFSHLGKTLKKCLNRVNVTQHPPCIIHRRLIWGFHLDKTQISPQYGSLIFHLPPLYFHFPPWFFLFFPLLLLCFLLFFPYFLHILIYLFLILRLCFFPLFFIVFGSYALMSI